MATQSNKSGRNSNSPSNQSPSLSLSLSPSGGDCCPIRLFLPPSSWRARTKKEPQAEEAGGSSRRAGAPDGKLKLPLPLPPRRLRRRRRPPPPRAAHYTDVVGLAPEPPRRRRLPLANNRQLTSLGPAAKRSALSAARPRDDEAAAAEVPTTLLHALPQI